MRTLIFLLLATLSQYPPCGIDNYYPECGVVTDVTLPEGNEPWDTVVTFETMNGNLFTFEGGEDLEEGDVIALIMNSRGTLKVTDDKVVAVRYCSPVNVNIIE